MPGLRLTLLAVALAAGAALAADVPAGPMPGIDGRPEADEWKGALVLRTPQGIARLVAAGRALCIAVEMKGRYAGERIELHVADVGGEGYTWYSFQPASVVPEVPLLPIVPAISRRCAWERRHESVMAPSFSSVFRARVHKDEKAWTAEIAIGLTAIGYHPTKRMVYRLEVSTPAGKLVTSFTPPRGPAPRDWPKFVAPWQAGVAPFTTLEEDERRALEFDLFREILDTALRRSPDVTHLGEAVVGRMNKPAVDALVSKLDRCVAADADDYFAQWCRVRVLRLANRLDDAMRTHEAAFQRFPLDRSHARRSQWLTLLVAVGKFAEAARDEPALRDLARDWKDEQARRAKDKDLPRVAFETTKGRVVVELFREDAGAAAAHVLARVASDSWAGAAFESVTGATHAIAQPKADGPIPLGAQHRRAWRGTLSLEDETGRLMFATGHLPGRAVGLIVEGMNFVDALEAGDKIVSASVLRK